LGIWRKRPKKQSVNPQNGPSETVLPESGSPGLHTGELAAAKQFLMTAIGQSDDFRLREFRLGGPGGVSALLAYLKGMADPQVIDESILLPLMRQGNVAGEAGPQASLIIEESLANRAGIKRDRSYQAALHEILEGNVALFVEGSPEVLIVSAAKFPYRSVGKPETEHSSRGSREGFTEVLDLNIALIRRRIKHPNLRVTMLRVGVWSRTQVAVVHMEGLTNPQIVETAVKRIKAIEIDQVQDSHSLEAFLKDHPFTPFPLIRSTERPDEAARVLLAGKVLILTDNTPFVLSAPSILIDFYQTTEDYVFGFWAATFVRLVRLAAWAITFFLPSLYIALIAVNPEMVPNELALTIASAREGLPFPPIIEVWIIETLMELIREAALRLPQPLGTTIGVVGGIVVGQAIVAAGVISPLMIVVAAVTMIASFTTPTIDMGYPWRILKWLLIILAHMFGLLGVIVGAALVFGHMTSLTSFGVPYLTPFAPLAMRDLKDTVVRTPLFSFSKRPTHLRARQERKLTPYRQPTEHPDLRQGQPHPDEESDAT
jgi:spore germination protein KA